MKHPLRFLGVLLALVFLPAARGGAATVEAVNKTQTRVIVKLTQPELAKLEDEQNVLVECGVKQIFVLAGTLTKLNPLKKTVVIVLDEAEPRLTPRMSVRFLSTFWNPVRSSLMTSYSQYHQYVRSSLEGAGGGFYSTSVDKVEDAKTTTTVSGTTFDADGYLLFNPTWFGAGFGYERRDATMKVQAEGDAERYSIVYNQLRPGFWVEVEDTWRIGLRYDYTLFDVDQKGAGEPTSFSYNFGQPVLGVTKYLSEYEFGITYKGKDKYTAVDTISIANTAITVKQTLKLPAELFTYFRRATSPQFVWGMGLGYVFFERELVKGEELLAKATPPEVLKFRASLEWRLSEGDKFDAIFTYDGGKSRNPVFLENVANICGFELSYMEPAFEGFVLGGTLALAGGAIKLPDERVDPATNKVVEVDHDVTTYTGSLLLFARTEFDLLAKARSR